jgi:FkbM family methyltransferase
MSQVVKARLSQILYRYYTWRDHPMKLRVWRWIRSATGYPLLTVPYCGRGWIALDEREYIQGHVLRDGLYEPEVWESLFFFANDAEVVWDVGAHIGTFAVRSMLDPRVAAVHAFEPNPSVRSALELNVNLNRHLGSKCSVHEIAIGSSPGMSTLYLGPARNTGQSSLAYKPSGDVITVRRTSIDALVYEERLTPPTLMKIDIEGAEPGLLVGATRFFREHKPKAIVLEAEADPNGRMKDPSIGASLASARYEMRWIRRPSREVAPRENYLAVHVG